MNADKMKKLKAAGWQIGSADEFLELSAEESALLDLKVALAELVRRQRKARSWTQAELADRVGSSQSRVAKLEAADPSISLDLQFRCAFAAGATRQQLAKLFSSGAKGASSIGRFSRR